MPSITHPKRGGEIYRPSWDYKKGQWAERSAHGIQTEMLESVRNTMEAINESQMLQCDVAHAIKDMAKTLRRIDRRLLKLEGAKLR